MFTLKYALNLKYICQLKELIGCNIIVNVSLDLVVESKWITPQVQNESNMHGEAQDRYWTYQHWVKTLKQQILSNFSKEKFLHSEFLLLQLCY